MTDHLGQFDGCLSCGEGMPAGECPSSKRPCGHHCDCSWTQDVCDWCGAVFGDVDDPNFGRPAQPVGAGSEHTPRGRSET